MCVVMSYQRVCQRWLYWRTVCNESSFNPRIWENYCGFVSTVTKHKQKEREILIYA
jgi:hypothetical protein